MPEKAKQRLHAIGKQVAPAVVEDETFEDVPPIKQVGPVSNGPRAQGKVVIITGNISSIWLSTTCNGHSVPQRRRYLTDIEPEPQV